MKAGQKIRNYILESLIGEGGVGEVWRARHESLDKPVAIKCILPQFSKDKNIYDRFTREASSMARLEHPHIVGVHDFFSVGDSTYLVMSYIEGGSLQDLLEKKPILGIDDAMKISLDILDALDYAHQRGVIHRDVKPPNILVTENLDAYLVDFGIALELGKKRVTQFGTNIGTPEYMSPEQIRGEKLDHRTDVYSFGCVLYEMLSGSTPFGTTGEEGQTDFLIMERHIKEPPPALGSINPDVDEKTASAVVRAMSKDKKERFPGCGDMAKALPLHARRYIGRMEKQVSAVQPHDPSNAYPARGAIPGSVKLALLLLALGTLIASLGWLKEANRTRKMAQEVTMLSEEIGVLTQANENIAISVAELRKELSVVSPVSILDIKLYNAKVGNMRIGAYTDTFRSKEIRFLYFRIKVRNNVGRGGMLGVQYVRPDGKVIRNEKTSPPGLTLAISVTPDKELYSTGLGDKRVSIFAKGEYRIRFIWQKRVVKEKTFHVK